jgi:plastin-1
MGVGAFVHNLQTDVRDGLILLRLFEKISPGLVQWHQVNQDPKRLGMYRKVENCSLCIKYGRDLGFSLVGIGGKDIFDGNRKFILALVWQMMQFHLLSILRSASQSDTKVTERDVLQWANAKITARYGTESVIDSLKSPSLQESLFIARLIECVAPGSVNFDFIQPGRTFHTSWVHTYTPSDASAWEGNAKYVISLARKIGCCVFLVWEDIVELHSKMIFSLLATLMLRDSQ